MMTTMRIRMKNIVAAALVGVSFFLAFEWAAATALPQALPDAAAASPVASRADPMELGPQAAPAFLTYTLRLPLLFNSYTPPVYLQTGIGNISAFLEQCPTNDPAYPQISADLTIRIDGVVVAPITCTEPISAIPIEQFTQQLITAQVFRTIYYMDPHVPDHLPWTSMSLYDWMVSNIGGINLRTAPGYLYCCDIIDGKKYIVQSIQSASQREPKRYWPGISGSLDFFAHEVRHADGGPGHTTGCEAFPDPGDPPGCDQSYDLNNLGSYGVQYWLAQSWLTGYLDVGISCNPATAYEYITWHLSAMNAQFRERFVENVPPLAEMPDPPYGGPCYEP